jgi:hypothetical protein
MSVGGVGFGSGTGNPGHGLKNTKHSWRAGGCFEGDFVFVSGSLGIESMSILSVVGAGSLFTSFCVVFTLLVSTNCQRDTNKCTSHTERKESTYKSLNSNKRHPIYMLIDTEPSIHIFLAKLLRRYLAPGPTKN